MSTTTSIEDLLTALNINFPSREQETAPATSAFPYGNRVALMGPPNVGKTVTVAGLVMRAEHKVAATTHTDEPFYFRVLEHGSDIHQDVSNLRDGHFPAKTQNYLGFRSSPGLLFEQKKFIATSIPLIGRLVGRDVRPRKQLWHKMLQLPICDLPGETLSQVIWQVRAQTGSQGAIIRKTIQCAINDMRECDAYIVMLKASLAKGLGIQLESEKDKTLSRDPDVNIVRMLEDLMTYKATHAGHKIKAVYVVISAWDKLKRVAERVGFDLLDPYIGQSEIEHFVQACFPATYAAIQSLRVPIVRYYPTFFQVETDDQGNEIMSTDLGFEDTPKIMTKDVFDPQGEWWQNARKISYSELPFDNLLNDLMKLAVAT